MTLNFFKQYQELFKDIAIYYDLSSRGIVGTNVQNIATSGINDGTLVGSPWTFIDTDRFGIAKNSNANFTTAKYIQTPHIINYQNGTLAAWIKLPSIVYCMFAGVYTPTSNSDLEICIFNDGTVKFIINAVYPSPVTVVANQWIFVVFSWGTSYKLNNYSFVGDTAYHGYTNSAQYPAGETHWLPIGNYWESTQFRYPFNGNIGEVMIWKDRQLLEPEIYELWKLTRTKYLYPIYPGVRGVE